MEKEELLKAIERLLGFDGKETTINPDYLRYFSIEELASILKGLEEKQAKMIDTHRDWMRRFKKEE